MRASSESDRDPNRQVLGDIRLLKAICSSTAVEFVYLRDKEVNEPQFGSTLERGHYFTVKALSLSVSLSLNLSQQQRFGKRQQLSSLVGTSDTIFLKVKEEKKRSIISRRKDRDIISFFKKRTHKSSLAWVNI